MKVPTAPKLGRKKRTQLDTLLARMRTMSLLAHGMNCVGMFGSAGGGHIEFAQLSKALSLGQYPDEATRRVCHDDGKTDAFGEARLRRWILQPCSAGWSLNATLKVWENGAYAGSIEAFRNGPAKSLLFDALAESIESEAFFQAADTSFEELCGHIGYSRRLSERIQGHLDEMKDRIDECPESAMKFLAATVAWYRYAILTLHSLDYVVRHLNYAMNTCDRIERRVQVGKKGGVSYPINMNEFRSYLIQMTLSSARFKNMSIDNVPEAGADVRARWQELAKYLVVR